MSDFPIALFIYNRPAHLAAMLDSLKKCAGFENSKVFVFSDGAKDTTDLPGVLEARQVAQTLLGKRAEYRFSDQNRGLARSIISGVTEITAIHGAVIVIEDDLILDPNFLTYMNAALYHYSDEPEVMQVSGYMFGVPELALREDALALPLTTTWGWATWARAWTYFDEEATGWEELLKNAALRKRFNLDGAYDYTTMIEARFSGRSHSWGILWYWSMFKNNGVAVFPPQSLVQNGGMDGTGTNGRGWFRNYQKPVNIETKTPHRFGSSLVDPLDWALVKKAIWKENGGWPGACVDMLKKHLKRPKVR